MAEEKSVKRTAELLSRNILDKVLGVQGKLSKEVRK